MFDPVLAERLKDRLGTGVERIPVTPSDPQTEEIINGFWSTWATMTYYLLSAGFGPRELIDSVNEISSVKEEVATERERV